MSTEAKPIAEESGKGIRKKIIRDIILDWPEPPVPFPKRVALPENPVWPLLVAPWRGGFQAMFDPATGFFHWRDYPPTWNEYTPKSDYILMGETISPDGQDYLERWLYNKLPGHDLPPTTKNFQVNDTGETDRNAVQRAGHIVNLGPQPGEVIIPQIYQASDAASLNKYLKSFRDQGIPGAICRGLDSGCSDPQFIVVDLI